MRTLPPYFLGDTVYCYFDTYDSAGASVTITGLAVTDIEVYKNGSMTQRASDNGFTLLDTDGIDLDASTGLHGFSIDTADNSDAGFWVAGQYCVHVNAITVDSQTVRFSFDLKLWPVTRGLCGTSVPAAAADGPAGLPVSDAGGLDLDAIFAAVDTEVAAIKAKTDNLPASPANETTLTTIVGYLDTEIAAILAAVDTEVAAIKAKTDNLPASPANETTLTTIVGYLDTEIAAILAAVDTEVAAIVTALTGSRGEPGQGAAAASASVLEKVDYLYKDWRNQVWQNATTRSLYNDAASVVDQKWTVSDDGTTFKKGEVATGP